MIEQNPPLALEITDALQHLETYQAFLQTKRILRNKTQVTLFDDFTENEVTA